VEVLNFTTELLIDGFVHSIKLVEDWGCCLGEDAFLTKEVTDDRFHEKEAMSDFCVAHGSDKFQGDVEALFDDIQQVWEVQDDRLMRTEAIIPPDIVAKTLEEQKAKRNGNTSQTL